ncbi:extracellular solute-binding protein [Pantoea sp. YU22]|uniref:ABC transporter substrate-binding protein n=1 Tax=Pantoea piersonii TaxID=2364647 RepID=A0AAJ5UB06_9GAMM|nr:MULTISPECIES: ABC transporter substrate-binding protein [Pantoea]RTY57886.1 extracellular solute-binding protein [Pantoea sp. YU22]WBG91835.1 ABC transporter substrate-binding protein [Pantoea piersonii]
MSTHNKMKMLTAAALLAACGMASQVAHAAESAICYNCPPEWADWGTQLKAIARDTGIQVPQDNKNSGQALAQMVAEKSNPVADVVYYGVSFGIQAAGTGVIADYKPAHWDTIPAGMKDPDGKWVALHSGTMGFMVNVDALGGAPVPQSWDDLLKPEYKGMVGYLDPSSAFVGYVAAVAVNQAKGGTMQDFTPALSWFKKLQVNQPIVPKQTAYARLISGEIPILLDYDFNAYRAKYKDHANVAFVIPKEGTVTVPYVISLVKNAPHEANGKKVIDYVLSDKGQAIWANAYLRPVRPSAMSAEAKAKFLPDSDYARAQTVDYQQMADAQKAFSARYLSEIR